MLRILFVDDQRVELEGMRQLLNWEELGLEWAGGVTDGGEALKIMRREPADIVVTDVIMQNMDGLTLVRLLKEEFPSVRTVCISGFDDFKFVGTAINNGASGYVLKPILANELRQVLERVAGEIRKERNRDELNPGRMALLLLGARPAGLDPDTLCRPVRLCKSPDGIPAQAVTGFALEKGGALSLLPADITEISDAVLSDPVPLKNLRDAYLSLIGEGQAAVSALRGRDEAVDRIRMNVERHLAEDVDVQVLLEGVFLSASHASALFKNATGMSIHRYVMNRRLTEAARLLAREPETRVKDIAWRCGFSDASHLINSFQKKYGMTPDKYRRRHGTHEADE